MAVDSVTLLRDLRGELKPLINDLRVRCDSTPEVNDPLREEWATATSAARTARSFTVWREDVLVDVAVAWLLAGVFVRFCEDNDLIDPPMLGGPRERLEVAAGHRTLYFQNHPGHGNREWLMAVLERAATLPGLEQVLGGHNPVWRFGPTVDGARRLIDFWERRGVSEGSAAHDFTDPILDTRFLGDLYQDLSDSARKRYALLQTPIFVEEFILDRTLEPAIAEFGLDEVSLIDPACGSGHFLLGAFARLLPRLRERHAAEGAQVTAQRALDAIAGIDLNAAAAAIARFRLLVAALSATGTSRLADLPDFHVRVAVGDSLLHGRIPGQRLDIAGGDTAALYQHAYATEDVEDAKRLLLRRYHAVVGNPPYINVDDAAMNAAYRSMFGSCKGKYALAVPFFERFFDLAIKDSREVHAGFVGLITAASFMKRAFGKTLVENFIPAWDISHVIDTSGAFIPGHPTATVIIFGRNRKPSTTKIRCVLGRLGEPSAAINPSDGLVWAAIIEGYTQVGFENRYVSVLDQDREVFGRHPWSLGGGGASELKLMLESSDHTLANYVSSGVMAVLGEELPMICDRSSYWSERGVGIEFVRPIVEGKGLRDWQVQESVFGLFPYDRSGRAVAAPSIEHVLWPHRTVLAAYIFYGETRQQRGLRWVDYGALMRDRVGIGSLIAAAEQASHNHFVRVQGEQIFKQTAPILSVVGDDDPTLVGALLAVLNSSTACFWFRQVTFQKGSELGWESRCVFDSSKLVTLPIPTSFDRLTSYSSILESAAVRASQLRPGQVGFTATPSRQSLAAMRAGVDDSRHQMIAAQEELDWHVMKLYGLLVDDYTYPIDDVPPLNLGERAFEIAMARHMAEGELETTWFARHGSTAITEIPSHWPKGYRQLVQRRIDKIESDRDIALIERPECKRRWASESWESQQERALRSWLLDRLERPDYWTGQQIRTTRSIAEQARVDGEFMQVAELYRGAAVDVAELVSELMQDEAVPYLAAWRYTESGLRKYAEWETTWALQRREDAGEDVGVIPVPPKYGKEDFAQPAYWPLRGKLDVPKERFVSYPGAQRENDPSPVMGWAGWNHLQRAQALAGWVSAAVERGAQPESLVPLLAGLWELVPWLRQWHNDVDAVYGERLGDFFATYCQQQAAQLDRSTGDLAEWLPPTVARRTRTKR